MKTIEEKAIELRNEYFRQYRKTHKEQMKRNNENYWIRKVEKSMKEGSEV